MIGTCYVKVFILVMILMIPFTISAQQLFVKNVGQWDSDIMYAGNGVGYNVVISQNGIYFNHQQVTETTEITNEYGIKEKRAKYSSDNFRLYFSDSKIENQLDENIISGKLSEITYDFWNYGPNGDWYWDVPCYEEIIVSDIYPGISMKFYYEGNNIRYDFEIDENANPKNIKMLVQGSKGIEIINNELIIKTKLGEIRNGNIKSFINSNGKELSTELTINQSGVISFDVAIDKRINEKITIDPLVYASYLYNQTAIHHDWGSFNVQQRGDEYWLRVWNYDKLNYYTDTLNFTNSELPYPESIIVYSADFKQIKKYIAVVYILTNKILFPDDEHLLITSIVPKEKFTEFNITDLEIKGALCLLKINMSEKRVVKGIRIPSSYIMNIYLSKDDRILISHNEYGSSPLDAYLTANAYFPDCDTAFSKNCLYPYLIVVSSELNELEFSALIPYSVPTSRYYPYVRISDVLSDSEGNIYFMNKIPYNYVNKYENIIGQWTDLPGPDHNSKSADGRRHYVSIHKFDKNYNFIKSVAVGFAEVRHFLIDNNDEIVMIGDIHFSLIREIWIKDDCLQPDYDSWETSPGDMRHSRLRVGLMRLNSDLEYLRSGVIPGNYFSDLFSNTTAYVYANLASDAFLDIDGNIYLTMLLNNYYFDGFLKVPGESFKKGNTVYGDGSNRDACVLKIDRDITKILYSTVYGGSGNDVPGFMFVQDTIVTIIGTTGSNDLIITPDADVSYPHNPTEHLFVVKLSTNLPVSVEDFPTDKPYIFPNPAYSYIELPESLMSRYSVYHVTDLLGRTILTNRLQIPRIYISTLPKGTYNLALSNGTSRVYYLFVKIE